MINCKKPMLDLFLCARCHEKAGILEPGEVWLDSERVLLDAWSNRIECPSLPVLKECEMDCWQSWSSERDNYQTIDVTGFPPLTCFYLLKQLKHLGIGRSISQRKAQYRQKRERLLIEACDACWRRKGFGTFQRNHRRVWRKLALSYCLCDGWISTLDAPPVDCPYSLEHRVCSRRARQVK